MASAFAQILLKLGATEDNKRMMFLRWQSLLGYTIYVLVVAVNMYLYKYVDLSLGAMLETLGYVFVLVLAKLVLKEKITSRQYIGMGLIMLGVILTVIVH